MRLRGKCGRFGVILHHAVQLHEGVLQLHRMMACKAKQP